MKTKKQTKKAGISLIVLVITIIVMIILAAAIILSLQSSGIIGKANKATTESNLANKKEAASVALAEYEIAKQLGNLPEGTTAIKYVQDALNAQGMDASNVAIDENNNIIVGSGALAINKNIPIGATITNYNSFLTEKSYSTDGKEQTYNDYDGEEVIENIGEEQTLTTNTELTWKYIGIDEKGNMLIAPELPEDLPDTNGLALVGPDAALYGVKILNTICENLYSSTKGTARSIKIEDINRLLDYTPEYVYYYDDEPKPLDGEITVGELTTKLGVELSNVMTPDGTNTWEKLSTYKLNYYEISENTLEFLGKVDTIRKNLVFSSYAYWIASHVVCLFVDLSDGYCDFGLRAMYYDDDPSVEDSYVLSSSEFDSQGFGLGDWLAIRPVVELNPDINITYDSNANTCTLN